MLGHGRDYYNRRPIRATASASRIPSPEALRGCSVHLHDAEDMAFGILAVGEPADSRNCHLGHYAYAAPLLDGLKRFIDVGDRDGVHARLIGIAARHQPSVDSGFPRVARGNDPVIHRTVPLI